MNPSERHDSPRWAAAVDDVQPPTLRHAVLGAGAVGLSLAGDLARAGERVVLVVREPTAAQWDGVVRVHTMDRRPFAVAVPAIPWLARPADVLWIAVRGPQLPEALRRVHYSAVSRALVVPLLDGLDHLPLLEQEFGQRLVVGAVRSQARRTGAGSVVRDRSGSGLELARVGGARHGLEPLRAALDAAGIGCVLGADGVSVLWRRLVVAVPSALAAFVEGGSVGRLRDTGGTYALMLSSVRELCALAQAAGAVGIDAERTVRTAAQAPDGAAPPLARDAAELVAVGRSVLRAADRARLPLPATRTLLGLVVAGARPRVVVAVAGGGG